jgi:hypothetical protein
MHDSWRSALRKELLHWVQTLCRLPNAQPFLIFVGAGTAVLVLWTIDQKFKYVQSAKYCNEHYLV